ncbi:hypothetical protein Tco_1370516 [Tanacetum coccineum]
MSIEHTYRCLNNVESQTSQSLIQDIRLILIEVKVYWILVKFGDVAGFLGDMSTLHSLLKIPEIGFEVLKLLENSVEVLKILENKLKSMKILENKLESLKLQENQIVDGHVAR